MIFSIKEKLFPIAKSILSIIGMTIFARMLILYGKQRQNEEVNKKVLLIGCFCIASAVMLYSSMFMKYIFKLKPAKRITVDRWFTVNPFSPLLIVLGILSGIALFIVGLWPVYRYYGAIFCVLTFIVLKDVVGYFPL